MGSRFLCLVGSLVVMVVPGVAERGGLAATPFQVSPHGGVVVDVTIDGHGPFPMIVDTGSTHSVITSRLAARLGQRPVAQVELSTVTGSQVVPVVAIEHLQVGPIAVPVMPAVVSQLPVPGEAEGLIGLDVLAERPFTIDYRLHHIVWHDRNLPSGVRGSGDVGLDVVDGRFVVAALVDGRPMSLVVDTASETLVMFAPASAPGPPRSAASLNTLARSQSVDVAYVDSLRIGRSEQRRVRAVYLGRPARDAGPVGLLPTNGFGRVTIDGPGRRLRVQE